jgi:peroxiredoxin
MATVLTDGLRARFARLQAERERSWSPAQLAANGQQRRTLLERFDAEAIAQPGDILPAFEFPDVSGGDVSLDGLTAEGPAVLVFFRFAGCPACNIALPYYEEALQPELRARDIPLVALSPQQPDRLGEIKARHGLSFTVATDSDNGLARHLGISFAPDNRPSPPPAGWIGEVTGTGSWELPQPAVLIVAPGRKVAWLQVSPDWLDRAEAEEIIAALDRL